VLGAALHFPNSMTQGIAVAYGCIRLAVLVAEAQRMVA
jgi:hypothetical protein